MCILHKPHVNALRGDRKAARLFDQPPQHAHVVRFVVAERRARARPQQRLESQSRAKPESLQLPYRPHQTTGRRVRMWHWAKDLPTRRWRWWDSGLGAVASVAGHRNCRLQRRRCQRPSAGVVVMFGSS